MTYTAITMCICSFKEQDIISEWDFKIDTVKAAPAAVPVATSTNRKTTKRQLLDNMGQQQQKRSASIQSDTALLSSDRLKRISAISKEDTMSVDESQFSTVTEEVMMDLSSKQSEVAVISEVAKVLVDIISNDILHFAVATAYINGTTKIIKVIHSGFIRDTKGIV